MEEEEDLLSQEPGEPETDEPLATPFNDLGDALDRISPKREKKERPKKIHQNQKGDTVALTSPIKPEIEDGTPLPTTRIYENGKEVRKRRAVSLGLSEFVLPPLTKRGTAVYEYIINDVIDPVTGQAPERKDAIIPGSYMFYDSGESDPIKRNKLLRNLGRPVIGRNEKGEEVIQDTVDEIEFQAGFKRVNIEKEFRTYIFLELHPLNESNKFRPKDIRAKFKRVDIRNNKSDAFKAAYEDLSMDAEQAVRNMSQKDQIIGFAVSADIPVEGLDVSTIKSSLRKWARENPRKFFSISKNVLPAIRLNVLDALGLGLLEYKPDRKSYYFVDPEEKIFTHAVDEEPVDAFAKMLLKDNAMYQRISDLLNYWE